MGSEIQSRGDERRIQVTNDDYDYDYDYDYDDNDDAFYAEIRRQILILTAEQGDEDDEIDGYRRRRGRQGPQAARGSRVLIQMAPATGRYFSWCEEETDSRMFGDSSSSSSASTPDWLLKLWRNNNKSSGSGSVAAGTGVFIPQIVKSGGRNRPRRRRSEGNNRMKNKQVQSV